MLFLLLMIPIFKPPADWQIAVPKNLSEYVQVGFVGESSHQFHPSINLAEEEMEGSFKEYLKAVKAQHLKDPDTKSWRDLGKFSMKGGQGHLTEIVSSSPWGDLKYLQAFLPEGKKVHILTAAVLKEEFPKIQKTLLESLQSMALYPDFLSPVAEERRTTFKSLFTEKDKARKEILENYKDLGLHWQFIALRELEKGDHP